MFAPMECIEKVVLFSACRKMVMRKEAPAHMDVYSHDLLMITEALLCFLRHAGDIKWNRQDLTLQYCSEEINCLDCLSPVGVHNGEIYLLTYFEQLFVCKIDHSAVQLLGLEVDNCTLIDRIYEHCMIYGSIKDVFRAIFIGSYTECIHPLPPPCQAPSKCCTVVF